MTHLETLIYEYLDWQGYLVRRNKKVGRLDHGGWEMELDIIAYRPASDKHPESLVHFEPSIDALSWEKREARYEKKYRSAKNYIFKEIFPWLKNSKVEIQHFAVFIGHPEGRDEIAGFRIVSIDEMMAKIRKAVALCGKMSSNAIPEQYPLLRTLQLSENGYFRVVMGDEADQAFGASA